jgi:hypothetical protein
MDFQSIALPTELPHHPFPFRGSKNKGNLLNSKSFLKLIKNPAPDLSIGTNFTPFLKSKIMSRDQSINPKELPEQGSFTKKEVDQHKQPPDTGVPLQKNPRINTDLQGKQANRTSTEKGLNEENSQGEAGAFEGIENQDMDK